MSELSSFFYKKNKVESHKKGSENKIFCNIIIPSEDAKILEFNHHQKSSNPPFIIYPDAECIIAKTDRCKNNSEYLSTTIVSNHIASGFSMLTISSFRSIFRSIQNKHDAYRDKDCVIKFCESVREHAIKIINFKKKKNEIINKQQQESYENTKICYIFKKSLKINIW